jgi:hypothetical protein
MSRDYDFFVAGFADWDELEFNAGGLQTLQGV